MTTTTRINPILSAIVIAGSLAASGCATKGYVRSQVQPVSTKVGQVAQQADQQGTQLKQTSDKLDQTAQQLQGDEKTLSATQETANSADSRSTDALSATKQNAGQINQLGTFAANLDDYKSADHVAVHFGFNKDQLTADDKAQLDTLATDVQNQKRYLITLEGFTDQTGPSSYNFQLSRRRAESVIRYLVGQHNIPIYRIHMVGMGKEQLVNGGRTRNDRAESRRVEVTLYTAPAFASSGSQANPQP